MIRRLIASLLVICIALPLPSQAAMLAADSALAAAQRDQVNRLLERADVQVRLADYGVKANILRSLRERGCRVIVLPHTATWSDVAASGADGLVLSNGPGDPAVLDGPVELAREALGKIPLFGICLGHQVMGRAANCLQDRPALADHLDEAVVQVLVVLWTRTALGVVLNAEGR